MGRGSGYRRYLIATDMVNILKTIRTKIDAVFTESMRIDGVEHLMVGLLIMDVAKYLMPIWAAILFTLFVLGAKELVYDKWLKQGTPEWRDFFWGAVGMVLGML